MIRFKKGVSYISEGMPFYISGRTETSIFWDELTEAHVFTWNGVEHALIKLKDKSCMVGSDKEW